MTVFSSRVYSGSEDLAPVLDLLNAVRPAGRTTDFPSISDLREILALKTVQKNTRLWHGAEDQLIGFALVDPYSNLWFEFDPQAGALDLETEIVAWGVECVRGALRGNGQSLMLDTCCREDDGERTALLERHGFTRQGTRTLHLVRPLAEPIPTPQLPAGFRIRPAAGEQEAEALAALHRAAFGTDHMTVEERLAMMRGPDYDPELDLVVIAPDGRLAAYCLCSISLEAKRGSGLNEGTTDPVATHPDFQRRGLARALLLTGMDQLKRGGADTANLGTSSENIPMQQAAQSVGFRLKSTTAWFAKPVTSNPAAGKTESAHDLP